MSINEDTACIESWRMKEETNTKQEWFYIVMRQVSVGIEKQSLGTKEWMMAMKMSHSALKLN